MSKIVKLFGVSVEASFCRIETLTSLLSYFPPLNSREKWPQTNSGKPSKRRKKSSIKIRGR